MKSTHTLSKMIKVEAWAKHLLKRIENCTKIEKASPYIKTSLRMDYEKYTYLSKMIKVEAWAEHLLKQIENYSKIGKSEPVH